MHPISDPGLKEALAKFESAMPGGLVLDDIPATRKALEAMSINLAATLPDINGVSSVDYFVPSSGGAPEVMVRLYRPEKQAKHLPALLWIHGGGYVLGSVLGDDLKAKGLAFSLNCVVVSVEYRLAPEHPFPAPLEDCYAALKWLSAKADDLLVNESRIAIGGASAGAGLAAGLALLARDRAEVSVYYQLLIYPMIDDTNVDQTGADTPIWSRANNLIAWRSYLGQEPGAELVSPYAAALRAQKLQGLPPTCISVGTTDLFLSESIVYAQRLIDAGVNTELHVYADGFHGFDSIAPETNTAQRFKSDYTRVVSHALHSV